jgi:hypothetical protein
MAWVKLKNLTSTIPFFGNMDNDDGGFRVIFLDDGGVTAKTEAVDAGGNFISGYINGSSSAVQASLDTWAHISMVFDGLGGNCTTYVDGVLSKDESGVEWIGTLGPNPYDSVFFGDAFSGGGYDAADSVNSMVLDDVRVYDRVWTTAELLEEAQKGATRLSE